MRHRQGGTLKKLGLTSVWEDQGIKLMLLDTNSATSITLWQTAHEVIVNPLTTSYPIFRTHDAPALRQEMAGRGIEVGSIINEDHISYLFFYDPDGNQLEACR